MPMLTVRLSDEEHAALRERAEGSSMAQVVKTWISSPPATQFRTLDNIHAACDEKIAGLERRLAACLAAGPAVRGPITALPPHMDVAGFCQRDGLPWPCPESGLVRPPENDPAVPHSGPRPTFLAAPNDDCALCSHDRQSFHLDGPCKAPKGRGRCGCEEFVEDLGFE